VAIIITGAERIPHMNAFLEELIGGTAMSFLRSFFLFPIAGDMDCSSVTTMQGGLTPEQATTQARVYGLLLRAFLQGKGNQPPLVHRHAHPERAHPARPARSIIPRSK
jgi:hypothetical protein